MKKVSVIVPCRNEEKYISKCLNSILDNDYKNVEILVIDGMSTDKTREIVRGYRWMSSQYVNILYNKLKTTQHAVNIGLKHATGDYTLEVDAHSVISSNYISKCVQAMETYSNITVGGITIPVPGSNTHIAKCIAATLADPFGVGMARYKQKTTKMREVSSVHCIMRDREAIKKVGGYNEKLTHSHDLEHVYRMRQAGIKVLQIPGIFVYYFARSDLWSFIKKAFSDGQWVILPRRLCKTRFLTTRHFVPLLFILTLPVSIFPYALLNIFRSIQLAFTKKLFLMPLVFFILHITYGLGSVYGLIKILHWRVRDDINKTKP